MIRTITALSVAIAGLTLIAAGATFLWPQAANTPITFTTLHGEPVALYGAGLYRYETAFAGAGSTGTDIILLAVVVPLLLLMTWGFGRGSSRAGLLLFGVMAFVLYVYAHRGLSNAYNELFLLYVALFSASLFAFILLFVWAHAHAAVFTDVSAGMQRSLGIFMFVCGLLTSYVWLEPLVTAGLAGVPPRLLDSYTTMVTDALDLGVIVPSTFLSGVLLLRGRLLGYIIALPLLVMLVLLGPTIALQTVLQLRAGVTFTPAEIVGPIAGFLVVGVIAVWFLWVILRTVRQPDQIIRPAA